MITNEQVNWIINGTHTYEECARCGHGQVISEAWCDLPQICMDPEDLEDVAAGWRCPNCGASDMWEAGHGWDFGFGWVEDRHKYGLDYGLHMGDFESGY